MGAADGIGLDSDCSMHFRNVSPPKTQNKDRESSESFLTILPCPLVFLALWHSKNPKLIKTCRGQLPFPCTLSFLKSCLG